MAQIPQNKLTKKREFPDAFVILIILLAIVTALTWILPASQYDMIEVNGASRLDPDSFHHVERTPVGIFAMFKAIAMGYQQSAPLLSMVLAIGCFVGLVNHTGAIRAAVLALTKKLGKKSDALVLSGIIVFFTLIGAFPSMMEAMIPFIPMALSISLLLGYDALVAVSIVFMADIAGWSAGPTNFYTVGNAQIIGGLQLYSGIGYRLVCMVVFCAITIWYVLRYANKIKKDPTKSLMYGEDYSDITDAEDSDIEFTLRHKIILLIFVATICLIVYGNMKLKWGVVDMAGVYLISAIICGLIAGYGPNKIAQTMLGGAQLVFVAAMAISVARSISVVMDAGQITYTIVHALVSLVSTLPVALVGIAMLVVQTLLNFLIPSGSSQALVTMPILMPMAELTGISKQMTILAFQFGDGLSNLGYPTMAALVGCLAAARVPFQKWFKYALPYLGLVYIASVLLLIGAVVIGY